MCDVCGYINGHHTRCPNYMPKSTGIICTYCNEEIMNGEEYITDNCGKYAHRDCLSFSDVIKFLSGTEGIMNMEDAYEDF